MSDEAKVNTPCSAYATLSTHWTLIDDLMAGSYAMQARSSQYLQQFPKEDPKHYAIRVSNSSLFGAYGDTADTITAKPFTKPPQLIGHLPEQLQVMTGDTDGMGKPLGELARELFGLIVNRGLAHILVDFPSTLDVEGNAPNLAMERQLGLRPRLIVVKPDNLIGWRVEQDALGQPQLTRIRILEVQIEPHGMWGEMEVQYVRVIEPNVWTLYRKQPDHEDFLEVGTGVNTLGYVPLVTGYASRTGMLMADPPLKRLAEENLAHFQSNSDQTNVLHAARTATLFLAGFTSDEAALVALGPNQVISTTDKDAKAGFVEVAGNAIEAGERNIAQIEERMMTLGAQPFVRNVGNQTATGQAIDEDRTNCDAQSWVLSLEKMIETAYAVAADWIDEPLPEDFACRVHNDFNVWVRSSEDVKRLIELRQANELSRLTLLREVQRRGVLAESVDPAKEVEAIEAEGPRPGTIGRPEDEDED